MDSAERLLFSYIHMLCPEFAERINNLRMQTRTNLSVCKHCGESIMWSSDNQYKYPLSPKDGSSHLCLTKGRQEENP